MAQATVLTLRGGTVADWNTPREHWDHIDIVSSGGVLASAVFSPISPGELSYVFPTRSGPRARTWLAAHALIVTHSDDDFSFVAGGIRRSGSRRDLNVLRAGDYMEISVSVSSGISDPSSVDFVRFESVVMRDFPEFEEVGESTFSTTKEVVSRKQKPRANKGSESIAYFLAEASKLRASILRRRRGKPLSNLVQTLREVREQREGL